jgi:hypothetical protein
MQGLLREMSGGGGDEVALPIRKEKNTCRPRDLKLL